MLDRGVGLLEVARRLNLALNTVKRYARIDQPERLVRAPPYRPTLVDPFRDYLRRRWEEDPAVPVLQLLNEITELGYTGSQNLLYRYITPGRVEFDRPAISPKRLTRYLLTRPDKLKHHQREWIDAATGACPEMTGLAALVGDFAALLTPVAGNDERLARWIDQAGPRICPTCTRSLAASSSTATPRAPPSSSHSTMHAQNEESAVDSAIAPAGILPHRNISDGAAAPVAPGRRWP